MFFGPRTTQPDADTYRQPNEPILFFLVSAGKEKPLDGALLATSREKMLENQAGFGWKQDLSHNENMTRPKSPVRLDWVDPGVCSLEYRLKLISRLPFFKHLPAEAIARINGLFRDMDVSTDERIYFEEEPAEYLYLVAMGKVKLVRNALSGREVLLDILRGGEYFGSLAAFGGRVYAETAIAQTDCCILQISATDFETILTEYPGVMRKALEAVGQRLVESQEIIQQLSAQSMEQRTASALLRLARKLGETRGPDILIQLPFSRQDLASMTGSTPETVSRVMSRLAEMGMVKSGRRWVTILDMARLEELAKRGAVN